jgi:hypothetical protein
MESKGSVLCSQDPGISLYLECTYWVMSINFLRFLIMSMTFLTNFSMFQKLFNKGIKHSLNKILLLQKKLNENCIITQYLRLMQ